jgi:hypothetical protein
MQEPGDGVQRWSLAAGGFAMVLLQCVACTAVIFGMISPSCVTNDQCETAGTFCGKSMACFSCGEGIHTGGGPPRQIDLATGLAYNRGFDPGNSPKRLPPGAVDWSGGFNTTAAVAWCAGETVCGYDYDDYTVCLTADSTDATDAAPAAQVRWCDACVHPVSGTVDATMIIEDVTVNNVAAMNPFNWLLLLLASVVLATSVVAELRDIKLCLLALDRADPPLPAGWRVALRGLAIARRYTFLPTLVMAVPAVVVLQGSDTLSICFNTVAVLFLTEVE